MPLLVCTESTLNIQPMDISTSINTWKRILARHALETVAKWEENGFDGQQQRSYISPRSTEAKYLTSHVVWGHTFIGQGWGRNRDS